MQKIDVGFPIDLQKLIESRMLIQANSGGGKSYLMRKIMEQIHGKVPFIVIDLEGEFVTLREKYDVIIFGKGHDIPLNVQHADKIAHYLLELSATAIIDLSELQKPERASFVRRFLESMINAPKSLWHPVVVIIDEAHQFCPEDGKVESADAVVDLCTRGRKRGYCAILATQRISSLRKGAVAELNNKVIGRTTLDTDVKRTAFELGMTNTDAKKFLSRLDEGEFYTFGTAISKNIEKHKISSVKTTHITTGMKLGKITPPSNAIQKLIEKISDIPKEVEQERDLVKHYQQENSGLKKKVHEIEKQLKGKQVVVQVPVKDNSEAIELRKKLSHAKEIISAYDRNLRALYGSLSGFKNKVSDINSLVDNCESIFTEILNKTKLSTESRSIPEPKKVFNKFNGKTSYTPQVGDSIPVQKSPIFNEIKKYNPDWSVSTSNGSIGKCERNILIALAQRGKPSTKNQIGILAGYAITSGSFNNSLSKLRTSGYVEGGTHHGLVITAEGLSVLGHYEPLPEGEELQRYWISELGKAESAILKVLIDNFPNEITKEQIAEACGYAVTSGSFNNSLSKLRTLELAEGRREIKASESLFG